jgi:flagellar biosynthesis/type III secretory pathway protein FliH
MVLTEFDEEKYLEMMRAEERAEALAEGHAAGLREGHASGLLEGLINILSDLGEIPEQVMTLAKELDADGIKQWSRLAVKSDTMEAFLQKIDS